MNLHPCLLIAPLLVACAGGPADAPNDATGEGSTQMQALCDAELASGAVGLFPYSAKGEAIAAYLDRAVTEEPTRSFYFETVLQSPVHHQERVLTERAAELGVAPCPYAAYLGFLSAMPIEAATVEDCVKACVERHGAAQEADCTTGCGG